MRKLVLAIIAILAVFTFIREYKPSKADPMQQAQLESPILN